jgi:hypothetical protein
MTTKALAAAEGAIAPIVVNVGKVKRSKIKDLERGEGKLMADVADVVEQVRASLGAQAEGVRLVPVVIVYQKKPKRRAGLLGL